MTDDLVGVGLVLVLLNEVRGSGEGDLVDIFVHLFGGHPDTVIYEGKSLAFVVTLHIDTALEHRICVPSGLGSGGGIFAHHLQLLELGDGIAAVGYELTDKDILIRVHPFLYYGKDIFA